MLAAGTSAQAASAVMANGPAFLIPSLVEPRGPQPGPGRRRRRRADRRRHVRARRPGDSLTRPARRAPVAAGRTRRHDRARRRGGARSGGPVPLAVACSSPAWRRRARAPRAAASSSAGSRRAAGGWRWASGRPRSPSASGSPRRRWRSIADRARAVRRAVGAGRRLRRWPPWRSRSWSSTRRGPTRTVARRPTPTAATATCRASTASRCLLVVPQFVVWTFALVWLIHDRGWSPAAAGGVVAVAQVAGVRRPDRRRPALRHRRQPAAAAALGDVVRRRHDARARRGGRPRLGRRRAAGRAWPRWSPWPTTAWPSPPSPSGPDRSGPAARSACRTPCSTSTAAAVPPVAGLAVTHSGYAALFALAAVFPLVAVGAGARARRARLQPVTEVHQPEADPEDRQRDDAVRRAGRCPARRRGSSLRRACRASGRCPGRRRPRGTRSRTPWRQPTGCGRSSRAGTPAGS